MEGLVKAHLKFTPGFTFQLILEKSGIAYFTGKISIQ